PSYRHDLTNAAISPPRASPRNPVRREARKLEEDAERAAAEDSRSLGGPNREAIARLPQEAVGDLGSSVVARIPPTGRLAAERNATRARGTHRLPEKSDVIADPLSFSIRGARPSWPVGRGRPRWCPRSSWRHQTLACGCRS